MTKGLVKSFFKFLNKNQKPNEDLNGFMTEDNIKSNDFDNDRYCLWIVFKLFLNIFWIKAKTFVLQDLSQTALKCSSKI